MIPDRPSDLTPWLALIVVLAVVSYLFFDMVDVFLIPLIMAGIITELLRKLNARITSAFGGRKAAGSGVTVVLLVLAILSPLIGIGYLAATQAASIAGNVEAFAAELSEQDLSDLDLPADIPYRDQLSDTIASLVEKTDEIVQAIAAYAASLLSGVASGAAQFFLGMFVFLYALFFFLQLRMPVLLQWLRYSGLPVRLQDSIFDRIVSISRATLKGTLTIGVIQGTLGGLSFWVAGIDGAVFWSVVMAILAVIPGLGAPFIIFCAAAYKAIEGDMVTAVGLAVWGGAVVGTIDNVLRPILVGRDANMHDIVILISSLGGLAVFGASGLVLGPVLAGVFITLWTEWAAASGTPVEAAAEEPASPEPEPEAQTPALRNDVDPELASDIEDLKRERAARLAREQGDGSGQGSSAS